jgi:hypothetical protein
MNSYKLSNGQRIAKSVIDRKVREAKKQKIANFIAYNGYLFCEDCGKSSGVYLDCSHEKSVNECQKMGKSELSWDIENIKIRCRACHNQHDKTY